MEIEEKLPTLIIHCPDGTVVKIYQHLTDAYIKELIDSFVEKKGIPIPLKS